MKRIDLIYRTIVFYKRFYKLIAIAAVITVAVITGSLVVGDSVRTTLVKRVTERLLDTETIIFSRNSFMNEKIMESPVLKDGTRGVLLMNGFVSQSGKLIPVFVWGINDRPISKGSARINTVLLNEIGANPPNDIVLRLPASGLIPSGSMFVTENYTTSMRLAFDGIMEVKDGGHISMKNEHAIPLNIFVNRNELAQAMEMEQKINLILANKKITAEEITAVWDYTISGLSVSRTDDFTEATSPLWGKSEGAGASVTEITTDRIFLQDEVVETICKNNRAPNRLFSYLANSIERGDASIPYSFVTALDDYRGETLQKDEIILSDYSAKRIQAQTDDLILVSYFTSKDLKTLHTDSVRLRVKKIVPLGEILADRTLSADFPGLSDVERCTDWDSDIPINMDLITDEDEQYWEHYKSAPKAILAYNAIADDWGNAFGNATAIRVANATPDLSELRAEMFGIQWIYPREVGLSAAKNGVDFSGLFLALGCFIIISAFLLMIVPLSEMLFQRKQEIALLKALGYTQKRISRILWRETAPVVLLSSVLGVAAGIIYTFLIMWLLGSVWKGATHTEGFSVYPDFITLTVGTVIGIGLSLWILRITIGRNLKEKTGNSQVGKISLKRKRTVAVLASLFAVAATVANFLFLHSATLFILVGVVLLGAASLWGDYVVCRNGSVFSGGLETKKLIWGSLYANRKQVLLSFFALAMGVFIVFSVGLNRKGFADNAQIRSGTGGYTLWGESAVPVYHNMSTSVGREKLSLTSLPADTETLQCLRLNADDASCLNLNKVNAPNVLGIDMDALSESDFRVAQNIYSLDEKAMYKRLQTGADSVYPALVDETVLTWSLGKRLGDTLYYKNDKGRTVAIQLAGTLSNTIFQGNILIDRRLFSEIWEETTGSEVFLLKTSESEKEEVKTLLSQALNEYGVRVTTTNERLQLFNTVTDTYLTIFMTLGGLGLLLGIASFIIVIRKSLSARRQEIGLYKTLGFPNEKIEQTLYRENLTVPLYAIATGILCSLAGIGNSFPNIGTGVWLIALFFTIFSVACLTLFVKKSVRNEVMLLLQL